MTVLSLEKGAYPKNVHTFLYCLIKLAFLSNIYVFGSFDKKIAFFVDLKSVTLTVIFNESVCLVIMHWNSK